jgi:hypothetical protein
LISRLAGNPASPLIHRRRRVRPLVRVGANHDHRPSLRLIEHQRSGSPVDSRDSGAGARLLIWSRHDVPDGNGRRELLPVSSSRRLGTLGVSPSPAREPTGQAGRHRPNQ